MAMQDAPLLRLLCIIQPCRQERSALEENPQGLVGLGLGFQGNGLEFVAIVGGEGARVQDMTAGTKN